MEHRESPLTATDVQLSDELLEKIDEVVPPGVTVDRVDIGWHNPALEPSAQQK